ncbi:hypothetical protein MOP89_07120 [Enterococcus gallinarum]|nr:hypothetical protein [Enterococcus gallinarum]
MNKYIKPEIGKYYLSSIYSLVFKI